MEYWIWLSQLKGIGSITQKKLLEHFFSPEAIYDATKQQLMEVDGIGPALTEVIKSSSLEKAEGILEKVNKGNIKILTYEDSFYPMKAKLYPEAPILLYYRGNLRQNSVGVGIVGARRCSAYGKEVTREAATFLAKNNIPVISGMAKGIDGYAHIACLKADGYTLAFLGSGVDICYPKEHDELMGRILEKGAILSEYPPGTKPKPEYFPKRNALISAWSEKLLVVEAGEKSGALITATLSEALHREVWAVPNTIYSQMGKGTNNLIASGAKIYLKPEQLMVGEEAAIVSIDKRKTPYGKRKEKLEPIKEVKLFTTEEQKIIDLLQKKPLVIEEIQFYLKMEQIKLIELLTMLELEGVIRHSLGGKWEYKSYKS